MASRWASAGLAVALLTGAPSRALAQLGVPPVQQAVPATQPQQPAGVAPGQQPSGSNGTKRLGRKYPLPMPPPIQREAPNVYVSVVSPRDSGVHQHAARQRMQRATRMGGNPGGDLSAGPPPVP